MSIRNHLTSTRRGLIAALASVVTSSSIAVAQDGQRGETPPAAAPAQSGQPPAVTSSTGEWVRVADMPPLFDVEFPGGTVSEYADALRRVAPGVNLVVMPEAARIALPPIRLAQVAPRTAVTLLDQQVHGGTPRLETSEASSSRVDPRTGQRESRLGQSAFVIGVRRRSSDGPAQDSSPPLTRVASLSRLLEDGKMSAAVVLEAVEAAVRATGLESSTTLAYHEPTHLLISSGPEAAVQAVDNVIGTLSPRRPSIDQKAFDEMQERLTIHTIECQRSITEAETRANLLQSTLERREVEFRELQEKFTAGAIERQVAVDEASRMRQRAESIEREASIARASAEQSRDECAHEVSRLRGRLEKLEALLRRNNIKFD